MRVRWRVLLLSLSLLPLLAPARGNTAANFYAGRQVDLIVGSGPGGGYDTYARLLAHHLAGYLPGHPGVVVQNMPGAGGLRAANYLYNVAPKDGTSIGTFGHDLVLVGLLGRDPSIQFDYPDSNAMFLAMDRNEIDARFTAISVLRLTRPQWLAPQSGMHVIVQFARAIRHADFPDVPTARELARSDRERALVELAELPYLLDRPFVPPPGLPRERAQALQQAFRAVQRDPHYLDEAARLKLDLSPIGGDEVLRAIARIGAASPDTLDYMQKLLTNKAGLQPRRFSMHDTPDQSHWHEPKAGENAGFGTFKRKPLPYDVFMEAEGVPVYRGIGVRRVQDLPMTPWKRLGGRGSYIQLYGTEGLWGSYVVEIPAAGALNVERHLYEKVVLVVEGRGSTEVWQEGQNKRHVFEWQKGSLFTIPLNAFHRFINAASAPALLLCGTTAPNVMNLIDNPGFIFDCPHNFTERFSGADDFFKPSDDVEPDPIRGLAMRRTNLIPDIVNTELPLDNRRSPGYRRVEPSMAGNRFYLWIGQHETGRYSKAHKHASAAVLICVKGKGYTYTWPESLGTTPWKDGKAEKILRQDYEPVGMVSAAPMSGDWFHQHFGTGREGLRITAWHGPNNQRARKPGRPGEQLMDFGAIDLGKGGSAIPYHQEDPAIRTEFAETLAREGVASRMNPEFYERPPGEGEEVMGDVM
jgi:tripartite-type tricarboxylate transporter receptor subunit TctC/quercetin dioxygenase-like cupin family protein